jgi:hypothetical protein
MITKYADLEVLEVKRTDKKLEGAQRIASFDHLPAETYRTDDDYMYVKVRAISSRVNKNNDGWPAHELAGMGEDKFHQLVASLDEEDKNTGKTARAFTARKLSTRGDYGFKTFVGRPIFVDHNNSDPERTRGVIVDSILHVEPSDRKLSKESYWAEAPDNHKPETWVELLLEIDAKSFPRLAAAFDRGDIDSVSMGCNVEETECSVCGHRAPDPSEYCNHIRNKGSVYFSQKHGKRVKAYEDCYGINFFEISAVFDPADETALVTGPPIVRKASEEVRGAKVAVHWANQYQQEYDLLLKKLEAGEITNEQYYEYLDQLKAMAVVDTREDLDMEVDAIKLRSDEPGYDIPGARNALDLEESVRKNRRDELLDKYPIQPWSKVASFPADPEELADVLLDTADDISKSSQNFYMAADAFVQQLKAQLPENIVDEAMNLAFGSPWDKPNYPPRAKMADYISKARRRNQDRGLNKNLLNGLDDQFGHMLEGKWVKASDPLMLVADDVAQLIYAAQTSIMQQDVQTAIAELTEAVNRAEQIGDVILRNRIQDAQAMLQKGWLDKANDNLERAIELVTYNSGEKQRSDVVYNQKRRDQIADKWQVQKLRGPGERLKWTSAVAETRQFAMMARDERGIWYPVTWADDWASLHIMAKNLSKKDGRDYKVVENKGQRWGKTAEYNGWTNWETWNVGLMYDNDYDTYQAINSLVENGATLQQFTDWVIENVIGPYNAERIADAKEWNSIPEDERMDYHFEDLKERSPQAADIVESLGFGADVSDDDPNIIDPNMVNWQELYDHKRNDLELPPVDEELYPPKWGKIAKELTDYAMQHAMAWANDFWPQEAPAAIRLINMYANGEQLSMDQEAFLKELFEASADYADTDELANELLHAFDHSGSDDDFLNSIGVRWSKTAERVQVKDYPECPRCGSTDVERPALFGDYDDPSYYEHEFVCLNCGQQFDDVPESAETFDEGFMSDLGIRWSKKSNEDEDFERSLLKELAQDSLDLLPDPIPANTRDPNGLLVEEDSDDIDYMEYQYLIGNLEEIDSAMGTNLVSLAAEMSEKQDYRELRNTLEGIAGIKPQQDRIRWSKVIHSDIMDGWEPEGYDEWVEPGSEWQAWPYQPGQSGAYEYGVDDVAKEEQGGITKSWLNNYPVEQQLLLSGVMGGKRRGLTDAQIVDHLTNDPWYQSEAAINAGAYPPTPQELAWALGEVDKHIKVNEDAARPTTDADLDFLNNLGISW